MKSRSTTSGALRRIRPLVGCCRYYPYAVTVSSGQEDLKKEVVQLGVELSLSVAESMFLLCDDIRTMLGFCFKLWKLLRIYRKPVLERLLLVMYNVYSKEIKPKNGVYKDGGSSVQWELIRTTWEEFGDGILVLHRLDMVLRRKVCSFEHRLLSSAIQKYKQDVLKKLEDKLRPANDVSKANGFARETIKTMIFYLWRPLFDEEAISSERRSVILADLFTPLSGKPLHSEILALPLSSPYILGKDFAMQELKQEVVELGVELSLYVAQSMFLLCDDLRTMLGFCLKLWRRVLPQRGPVLERLLLVIHYVYSKEIKPKNGVYHDGGNSVQWELIRTTRKDFCVGIIVLHHLDMELRREVGSFDDRQLLSAILKYKLEVLKKLDDKLRPVRDVLEANGFVRETIRSISFDLWRSLFDEKALSKKKKSRILADLFTPLWASKIRTLPVCSPYILGKDFGMQEVKEEVVRLGVELSLHVAESMFLMCDDVRTMLLFCHRLYGDAAYRESHVMDRFLRVMHHVYTYYIKPKGGAYLNDGKYSVQWKVIRTTLDHFDFGFRELDRVVRLLRGGGTCGREITFTIEEAVKKTEEKLWFVKVVSEENGFVRDVMESHILDLWKPLFVKGAKEAKSTLKHIKCDLVWELFGLLYNEAAAFNQAAAV